MSERVPRLGDVIDDYCPRCRLLLNHAVASLVGAKVVKVICQTCHSEHPYRHAEVPAKKKPSPRGVLFDKVLAKAAPATDESPTSESAALLEAEDGEQSETAPQPPAPKKKRAGSHARYISRHKVRPPRKQS